ncbi:MAG: methyltransferase domain-containing protein [Woeseiaceae bacterium]|nr:methyltransferase domain-containing protein [Woeseiaceae bacterium]
MNEKATGSGLKEAPWQLAMFRKGLKKRLRLKALTKMLAPIGDDEKCLLLTCGDNNGAMNYFLRDLGGRWFWADLEDVSLAEMSALLGESVALASEDRLPFEDAFFDRIVVIDVHEHVDDPRIVTRELVRILKPGAQLIVTTPNGDETKIGVRIKSLVGMSVDTYGHKRVGLTRTEIETLMSGAGVKPVDNTSFSRFFTEMLELTINFLYVKVLRKNDHDDERTAAQGGEDDDHVEIAPATADQLRRVRKSYRIYSVIFPVYWLISQLDHLLFFDDGYCVVVAGRREQ